MLKKTTIRQTALFLISITTMSHTTNKPPALLMKDYAIYKPITLDEVANLAYENRKDLEGFKYIIKGNWYAERAALGGFLPQINIKADSGTSSRAGVSGIGQLPIESININISQLIFSADGPMKQYKIAQEETNISRTQKDQLKNSIRFNSEKSFLELKKAMLQKELIKSLDDSSIETFDQNITRQKVGFLSTTKWKNAQAEFSKGQTDVKNYPLAVDNATITLERETDAKIDPENISLEYKNIDDLTLLSLEQYYDLAIINRPDLAQKRHQIKQAKYSNQFYKYKYIPEIRFGAQIQKSRMMQCPPTIKPTVANLEFMGQSAQIEIPNNIPFDNKPLTWHIGLNATWNFDGLSNFNTSKKFDNFATNFILQKKDLELNILREIEITYNNLTTLLNLIKPTKKRYDTAKARLKNLETQYNIGLAALFQYKQVKLTFKQADFNLTSIKIDVRNNYQRLLFLCGYPHKLINS